MKNLILIFTGYNDRATVAFLRTLDSYKLPYAIIASSEEDRIFLTKYKNHVLAVRKSTPLVLSDLMESIAVVQKKIKADRYLIMPSTEALNRFVLDHRDFFRGKNCELPLVDKELYEIISDKYGFQEACLRNGILVPREYSGIDDISLPYVAKPKRYLSESGTVHSPVLVFSQGDHQAFMRSFGADEFYYQEFIGGKSLYLLYYFSPNGDVYKFSQENHMQQSGGKSIVAAISSDFHHSEESFRYEAMFKSIGFSGLVMVEVRQQGDRNYMIEANPRFWGPSQLFVDAGMNFFEAFLYDLGMIMEKPVFYERSGKTRYFWSGGLPDDKGTVYHNYTPGQYSSESSAWYAADVYNRDDTWELFDKEMRH